MNAQQKAQQVSRCLQLAITLEVSVPKPGNVSFTHSFESTKVEHFLASAIAAGPCFETAAYRGVSASDNRIDISHVGVGELIKSCVADVVAWQHGGNTILGTVMLMVPLAVAAGMTPARHDGTLDFDVLRQNLTRVVKSTTASDAVYLYEAIDIAVPSGLGGAPDLDLNDPTSKKKLISCNVSLFEVFKLAADYDDICYEWVNDYSIIFDLAYPVLAEQIRTKTFNTAVVNTFLTILAERPDTFIARKLNRQKAQEISSEAKKVLRAGGVETSLGKLLLDDLDSKLCERGNSANPGTTADLTAATIALCTLNGYRP